MSRTRLTVSSEEEWLKLRREVVTATESASLVGANRFRSIQRAWDDKMFSTFKGNAYTIVGQMLEPVVVDAVNRTLDTQFMLFEQQPGEKVFYMDTENGLGATPDAHQGYKELLECKTTGPMNLNRYRFHPPEHYIIQLQTQLHCTDIDKGYLAIMGTDLSQTGPELQLPLIIFEVDRSPLICENLCKESLRFWECQKAEKQFRVDPKVKSKVRLCIQTCYKKIL